MFLGGTAYFAKKKSIAQIETSLKTIIFRSKKADQKQKSLSFLVDKNIVILPIFVKSIQ